MEEKLICQCCGMPLTEDVMSKNIDGSINNKELATLNTEKSCIRSSFIYKLIFKVSSPINIKAFKNIIFFIILFFFYFF